MPFGKIRYVAKSFSIEGEFKGFFPSSKQEVKVTYDSGAVFVGLIRSQKRLLEGKLTYEGQEHIGTFQLKPIVDGKIKTGSDFGLSQIITDLAEYHDRELTEEQADNYWSLFNGKFMLAAVSFWNNDLFG